ncbi:MAG TPA: hypothetical protein VMX57_07585 [Planctomycetota bacterium]|nr:hypothetical protein [Planctomycetota bacterium]
MVLLVITGFLVLMHLFPAEWSGTIHNRFDLDAESNVPTWFATVLLFCVSLTAFGVFIVRGRHASHERGLGFWAVFAGVYCFLSADEGGRLHEACMLLTHVHWLWIYAAFAAAFFALCLWYFLRVNRDRQVRNLVLGGMILYALGGMGCEAVGFFLSLTPAQVECEVLAEEALEMLGSIAVLSGCLVALNRSGANVDDSTSAP